jgi:hypothetical protein
MEHLAKHRENQNVTDEECVGACTPYHLSIKIYDLKTQRLERVQMILELLRTNNLVATEFQANRGTYYSITDNGYSWYRHRAVQFMTPFMPLFSPGKV